MEPKKIKIEDFDYELPADRIAQYPLEQRDHSKLLVYKDGHLSEMLFKDIHKVLPGNSLLIMNETKVIRARLHFRKETGAQIEIFCLEPVEPTREIQQAFSASSGVTWKCLVGNAKRWKDETLNVHIDNETSLMAEKVRKEDDHFLVRFRWSPIDLTFSEVLEKFGKIPLPPYIGRDATDSDLVTYQTVYAANEGSVAAPTAGLHFTREVFDDLRRKDIVTGKVTLHVGAGTFRPVTSGTLEGHLMHTEQVFISRETIAGLLGETDRTIILVGTTTTRLIESIYWHGVKLINGWSAGGRMDVRQWDPYQITGSGDISKESALKAVLDDLDARGQTFLAGNTSLLIAPGYRYRFPDILITNFHQPRSTLLLLIAAFLGDDWRKAYRYALDHEFRFLSYGDSCLFFRP